jgi:hypothetical protein
MGLRCGCLLPERPDVSAGRVQPRLKIGLWALPRSSRRIVRDVTEWMAGQRPRRGNAWVRPTSRLTGIRTRLVVVRIITKGKGEMPSFKGKLSDAEIKAVFSYVTRF